MKTDVLFYQKQIVLYYGELDIFRLVFMKGLVTIIWNIIDLHTIIDPFICTHGLDFFAFII